MYLTKSNCDLQIVGGEFSKRPYGIAIQKGSPIKDEFNTMYGYNLRVFSFNSIQFHVIIFLLSILRMLNTRHLDRLQRKWWNQTYCEKPEDTTDGITIQNVEGAYLVIVFGIALACVSLFVEYIYKETDLKI